jgi:hypothetical protein
MKMSFKDFEEIFNEFSSICYKFRHDDRVKYIWDSVDIGGSSGGSCWGGQSTNYSTGLSENDIKLKNFDDLIERLFPDISFMRYKKLINNVNFQTRNSNSYGDYYGNYSETLIKYISAKDLYDSLIALDFLETSDEN